MLTSENKLRRVVFRPYRPCEGPVFTLITWDTGERSGSGPQWGIGYKLMMRTGSKTTVLFEAEDYGCSPMHAIDSDESVKGLMGFLTLRPGDTDREYFRDYTQVQLDYCGQHAEALSSEVDRRFGEDR